MKLNEKKILLRAENLMTTCKDTNSLYYKELEKSFKEYKKLNNKDKTTEELYLTHISKLCDFISEKKNATISVALMIVMFTIMVGLTTYSTFKYYNIASNLKNNVIQNNKTSSLVVNYNNLDDFEALVVSDIEEHSNLSPLTLTIGAINEKNNKMQYNIYIIEQNNSIKDNDLLNRDVLMYNVKTNNKDSSIKYLKDAKIYNDKILLFSNIIRDSEVHDIEIRMWIDKNTKIPYLNKNYKFTIYVEGYEL